MPSPLCLPQMLLSAGPNHKRPASVTAPRLFTYVGYHRLRDPEAPTVNTAAAAATLADAADPPPGKAGGKGRSKRGAGGGAGASTSTAPPSPPAGSGAGGQGIGAFVPPALVPPEAVTAAGELQVTETGWRQDQDGGWLVRMLLDVFAHSWQLQVRTGSRTHAMACRFVAGLSQCTRMAPTRTAERHTCSLQAASCEPVTNVLRPTCRPPG